jgi:hypothetical protein
MRSRDTQKLALSVLIQWRIVMSRGAHVEELSRGFVLRVFDRASAWSSLDCRSH